MSSRVKEILFRLNVEEPTLDAFATEENHRFPTWFGRGGVVADSFTASWGAVPLLWANPPYSQLDRVVEKVIGERARAVLVVPGWREEAWWKRLQPYVKKSWHYAVKTEVFELAGKRVEGIRWPLWAYLVDARAAVPDKQFQANRKVTKAELDGEWTKTASWSRRQRRKRREGYELAPEEW
jgi:hypothetical protein